MKCCSEMIKKFVIFLEYKNLCIFLSFLISCKFIFRLVNGLDIN